MVTISTALPLHWWSIDQNTFNESQFGFVLSRPYYHEWLDSDIIKDQITDTEDGSYTILFYDESNNLITSKDYVKTIIAGLFVFDLEFSFGSLPVAISDKKVRCYISNTGSLDSLTLDSTTLDTTGTGNVYKTDFMNIRSAIYNNQGWGSIVMNYKSSTNYYNIQYPNNGDFFNLRIPGKFFSERIQETVNEIQLSDNVLATSRTQKFQTYLEPYQLPAYMMKKIAAALSHDVSGSAQINGVEYQAENFDWSQTNSKAPFFKGKVWLTDKKNFIRNII